MLPAVITPAIPAPPPTIKVPVVVLVLAVVPVKDKLVPVATPKTGVTKVGLVANTAKPVPVSSIIFPANSAEVVADKSLILLLVYIPFVTVAAFPVILPAIVLVTVKFASVPTDVKELAVTPFAKVEPDKVPAGAITSAVIIPVVNPFAFIVITGIAVDEPVVPAVATVANVNAFVLFAVPSKELPALVASPVVIPIVRAVVNLGAETIVITGEVVVFATVASALAEVTEVTVPDPFELS